MRSCHLNLPRTVCAGEGRDHVRFDRGEEAIESLREQKDEKRVKEGGRVYCSQEEERLRSATRN